MLHNLDTIYDIARSSKNFSTQINFSENIFLVYRGWVHRIHAAGGVSDSTTMLIVFFMLFVLFVWFLTHDLSVVLILPTF